MILLKYLTYGSWLSRILFWGHKWCREKNIIIVKTSVSYNWFYRIWHTFAQQPIIALVCLYQWCDILIEVISMKNTSVIKYIQFVRTRNVGTIISNIKWRCLCDTLSKFACRPSIDPPFFETITWDQTYQ